MRPLVLALSALIAGTLVTPSTATAAPTGLQWQPCADLPLECAKVSVPLDYRKPGGTKIDIAVSRKKSGDPARRRGVLLLNPGGPGGAGRDLPVPIAQLAPRSVTDAYDLIGFDPRGTGQSAPNTCALTPEQQDPTKVLPYPAPNGDITGSVAYAKQIAKQCFEHSGARLPYVTTANTARDMDMIRAALGERKISYFGVSYGSYLGAVYTTMFPQRSDRILLDSVVDPRDVWRTVWQAWGPATEERFEDFAKWAAERNATYELGATPKAVRDTYLNLAKKLDTAAIGIWTGNNLRAQTRGSMYFDAAFEQLAAIMQSLVRGNPDPVEIPPLDQSFPATLWGIVCGDADWPGSIGLHQWQVLSDKKKYPITNGLPSNIWPCAFWPTEPIEPRVRITDRGPSNVLLTQNLRDPATPLVGAVAMRAAMGNRAKLVTADQGGHGTYLFTDNACVSDIATTFLVNGTLPAKDVACGPQSGLALDAPQIDRKRRDELVKQLHSRQMPF
ncbi:pimeloyl-ACP methyl ester carboxylesterase [Kibdelosporangium banguiense]|uniref:Pimeloyl-ACP methyl ester carboxylesterase n=1 Tax=Kibdelosporangium banguiense TaxID=1365924 RepID=A0ABS4U3E2_9PSEU|nr:alpha/beta hydrolase [Kibdelosporangium banguiense]MBP2331185.1 pimeloyl-ACP methyl ester carboxylesterase [Kibdelosporangium banguiense]